jgi:hypothetical protein
MGSAHLDSREVKGGEENESSSKQFAQFKMFSWSSCRELLHELENASIEVVQLFWSPNHGRIFFLRKTMEGFRSPSYVFWCITSNGNTQIEEKKEIEHQVNEHILCTYDSEVVR